MTAEYSRQSTFNGDKMNMRVCRYIARYIYVRFVVKLLVGADVCYACHKRD